MSWREKLCSCCEVSIIDVVPYWLLTGQFIWENYIIIIRKKTCFFFFFSFFLSFFLGKILTSPRYDCFCFYFQRESIALSIHCLYERIANKTLKFFVCYWVLNSILQSSSLFLLKTLYFSASPALSGRRDYYFLLMSCWQISHNFFH